MKLHKFYWIMLNKAACREFAANHRQYYEGNNHYGFLMSSLFNLNTIDQVHVY
jgi:hypothetical protein